ncbi:uncharacterized protein F4817DRAFT_317180 [Daldinia loculata]|uniref:uncharacterized protein n=1 Tax=Daldinia loculata TaxID=103429 RepID=UPI0020C52279|nr:uncharacterized protein F4817DRAFT_317180 [Daldinia loculata]KAI1646024.1 hypothetical protein F4817DRAFT_317180 [Daldinia loculata]
MSDNHHLLSKSPISALEKIPKIAAWLNIDDPCPPDPVKTYRSSTTSNSFPTIATDTSENTLGYLKFESFRSCTLRNNGIELLRPYTTLPDWVQEHIDQVNSVEGDDIPTITRILAGIEKWKADGYPRHENQPIGRRGREDDQDEDEDEDEDEGEDEDY